MSTSACNDVRVTFDTYPDSFIDYENYIENYMYDDTLRYFSVHQNWAVDFIKRTFNMSFDEFMLEYTWDDTWLMYDCAVSENVITNTIIMYR